MKIMGHVKKGTILLHTLVMAVILSMISIMVIRWVLARYIIANRIMSSAKNTSFAQGYAAKSVESFNSATDWDIPDSGEKPLPDDPARTMSYTISGSGSVQKMDVVIADQY